MLGRRSVMLAIPLLLLGAACTSRHIVVQPPSARGGNDLQDLFGGQETKDPAGPGVDLVPLSVPQWIFGLPVQQPQIQPPSARLARLPTKNPRLHVTALPSGAGTAAIAIVEDSPRGHRWGELMTPAQRRIFSSFASDHTLGSYLVIVDDVHIESGIDPIPMVAYRWPRQAVQDYAHCGIPSTGIDSCTARFYTLPQQLVINGHAGRRGF